jgi:hypothetical protein
MYFILPTIASYFNRYCLYYIPNEPFMKKATAVLIILTLLHFTSFAQIKTPVDSISTLLCKQWVVDYAMMGNMKIGKPPGTSTPDYQFNENKKVVVSSGQTKDKTTGTWSYDSNKKVIKIIINGKTNGTVVSLTATELIMLIDTKQATPEDEMAIRLVYKLKTE